MCLFLFVLRLCVVCVVCCVFCARCVVSIVSRILFVLCVMCCVLCVCHVLCVVSCVFALCVVVSVFHEAVRAPLHRGLVSGCIAKQPTQDGLTGQVALKIWLEMERRIR